MTAEHTPQSSSSDQPQQCPECHGRGWKDHRCLKPDQATVCQACNGRGTTLSGETCYGCHGTGLIETRTVEKDPCPRCNGAGVFPVPEWMHQDQYAFIPKEKK